LTNLRCLNLLNNQIDDKIIAQMRYFVKNDYDIDSLSSSTVYQSQNTIKAPLATPDPSEYSSVNYDKFHPKESKQNQNKIIKSETKYNPIINNSTNHYDNNNILLTKRANTPLQETARVDLEKYNFINTNLNDVEIHKRDQLRLDQYFKNAEKYKNRIDHDPYSLERSLERDFDTLLRYEKKFIQNKNEMTGDIDLPNDKELIKPVDDLRFRTHNVLPFNLIN
jgi:hypothetical protein